MKKKNKKWIISGIVLGLLVGTYFIAKLVRKGSNVAKVQMVSEIAVQDYGMDQENLIQANIYQTGKQSIQANLGTIQEVYVEEGQTVKKGDRLVRFDQSTLNVTLQQKELEIAKTKYNIEKYQRDMNYIESLPTLLASDLEEKEPITSYPELKKDEQQRYNYIHSFDQAENAKDQHVGTLENPYVFKVIENGAVSSEFIQNVKKSCAETLCHFRFIIGDGQNIVSLDSEYFGKLESNTIDLYPISLFTDVELHQEVPPTPKGMTAQQKAVQLLGLTKELQLAKISVQKQQLEYDAIKDQIQDAIVYANNDGVIHHLQDLNNLNLSQPLMEVEQGAGTALQGQISEYRLNTIAVDQEVFVQDMVNGKNYRGKIHSIDQLPLENYVAYDKQNVSMFGFIVYIDDVISNENTYFTISLQDPNEQTQKIYIQNMYIRYDGNQAYVMKDDGGRLVRQNVEVGKSLYGYATEIVEGLTMEDAIGFPYGEKGQPGTKTEFGDLEGGIF